MLTHSFFSFVARGLHLCAKKSRPRLHAIAFDTMFPPSSTSRRVDPRGDVTRLLEAWRGGDGSALGTVVQQVHRELMQIARRQIRGERKQSTLDATALLHETYLRMQRRPSLDWASRQQFFGWAATLMRHVLIDRARRRLAAKRGADAIWVSLDDEDVRLPLAGADGTQRDERLLALDDALARLRALDERQALVVELRHFVGLDVEQVALALDISAATVKREWATARAWLLRELQTG
jgi:RNA polymerase sigma factor (TIGR02999 family)